MLTKSKPEDAKKFFAQTQTDADRRWRFYQFLAQRDLKTGTIPVSTKTPSATADQQP
jgi:hypothetical protein